MIRSRSHKSIRRAARARIFSSEAWTRQYKKARGGWQYHVLIALAVLFLPILLLIAVVGFPAGGGFLFATGKGGSREVISIVATLLAAVVGFGQGGWLLQELVASRSLAVTTQIPISDRAFLARQTRLVMSASCVFLVVLVSFFVATAVGLGVGPAKGAMIVGLAVIQWSLVVSLSLIMPAWFPRLARAEAIGGIVSVVVMLVVASVTLAQMNLIQLEAVRLVALSIVPTGWVFLLLEFGILDEVAISAWLLVPCLLTVVVAALAYVRMKAVYRPWEISLESEFFARVLFEPPPEDTDEAEAKSDLQPDAVADDLPSRRKQIASFVRDWAGFSPEQIESELSRGEACDRVRSRKFLEPYSWPNGGLIERMTGSILSDREQRVAELMCCGEPEWSRRTLMDMGLGCLGLAFIAILQQVFGMKILMLAWHIGLYVLFIGLRRSWPGVILRCNTGHVASIMGLVPISHREMNRAVMVLGTVRALVYVPFALAVSVAGVAGIWGGFDLVKAAFIASKAVLIIVAIHQWWFIALQPHQSSKPILTQIGEGLLFVPVMFAAIGGGAGMLAAGRQEMWSMGGAALMFGAGWFAQRWQQKRILNGPIDFITLRTNQLQQQLQAQRKKPTATW
jgi:hypothetical protein